MISETSRDFLEDRFWEAIARLEGATTPPVAAACREAAQHYARALRRHDPRPSQAMEKRDG